MKMAALSPFLRSAEGDLLIYRCPGCSTSHGIQYGEGNGLRWTWNGDVDKPTFSPSIVVEWRDDNPAPNTDHRCHSYITDGRIRFLPDSTHELADKCVDLPAFSR